jgi:hypothetical protein
MNPILKSLEEAEKKLKTIDHILYVTFPLLKDKKILLKTMVETKIAINNCINSILQYEYIKERINLSDNPKQNLKIFIDSCAQRYRIEPSEIKKILDLFELVEKHKKSSFEFVKENKIIILSESMQSQSLTLEKAKEFLILGKNLLKKTKETLVNKV